MNSQETKYICSIDPGYVDGGISFLELGGSFPPKLVYRCSYPFQLGKGNNETLTEFRSCPRPFLFDKTADALLRQLEQFELFFNHTSLVLIEENDLLVTREHAPMLSMYFKLKWNITVRTVIPTFVSTWLKTKVDYRGPPLTRSIKKKLTAEFIDGYPTMPAGLPIDQCDSILNAIYYLERCQNKKLAFWGN